MHQPTDLRQFAAAPMGRFVRSQNALCWYYHGRLSIVAMWGCPQKKDIDTLQAAMDADWNFRTEPFMALLDFRRLQLIDEESVSQYGATLLARQDRRHRIERCGVIIPADSWVLRALAAAVPGMLALDQAQSSGMQYSIFVDAASALAWLGWADKALEIEASLDEQAAQAQAESAERETLRQYLFRNLHDASLSKAAKELGVSSRTLQRRLQESQTTFQDELAQARIDRAKELLSTTGMKLLAVAQEVGYKKQPNFSFMFRKLVGRSPVAWRKANQTPSLRSAPPGSSEDPSDE